MYPYLSLQTGNWEPDVLLTGEWKNKCQQFLQIPAGFSRCLFSFLQRRVCQRSWKALSTCGRRAEWRMSSLLRRSRWCGTSDIITGYSCHAETLYKSRVSLESMDILRWHLKGLELSGAYIFFMTFLPKVICPRRVHSWINLAFFAGYTSLRG